MRSRVVEDLGTAWQRAHADGETGGFG
jgi:hypothetical protein